MGSANPANVWSLKDPAHAAQFRTQHHLSHATYEQLLAQNYGISLPSLDFTQDMDRDWHLRHGLRHKALLAITAGLFGTGRWINAAHMQGLWKNSHGQLGTWIRHTVGVGVSVTGAAGTVGLLTKPRSTPALKAWMQYHAQLHVNLDTFFGLHT